jgi:hypothetical protein
MRFEVISIKMFNTTEKRTFQFVQNPVFKNETRRGTPMNAQKVRVRNAQKCLLITVDLRSNLTYQHAHLAGRAEGGVWRKSLLPPLIFSLRNKKSADRSALESQLLLSPLSSLLGYL